MADLNVIYRIAADISGLQSGVDRAAKATEGLEGMAGRLQGVLEKAFTVAAVAKLTSDVVHFASALSDLSQQTGISTTDLQKFDLAFAASGVSMETVATNATKLSKALVEGDTSTVGALQKLGLNVKELKAQNPGDTFLEVADAIGKIPNPTEKAWVALQVFGKGGAELLKGLTGNLKETTDQFEKLGLIVDEHTVKAIDDFGDQMGLLGKALIAVLAQIVGPLMPALTELTNILLFLGKIVGDLVGFIVRGLVEALLLVASTIDHVLEGVADAVTKIPLLGKHLGFAADAAEWFRKDAEKVDALLGKMALGLDKTAESTTKATGALQGFGKVNEDAERALKEYEKALKEYSSAAGPTYYDLITKIGNATYEGIAYDLKRGQSVNTLTQIYKVSATVIGQVADAERNAADEAKRTAAIREAIAKINNQVIVGEIDGLKHLGRAATDAEADMIRLGDANKKVYDQIHQIELGVPLNPSSLPGYVVNPKNEVQITKLKSSVDELAKAFAHLATVSKGQFSDIARAIGETFETMDIATKSAKTLDESLGLFKKGDLKGGIEGATQAFAAMTGAMIQATSHASTLQNVIQGGLTGASFGGPVGALAGMIVGIERSQANHATLLRQIRDANDQLIALHGSAENLARAAQTAGFEVDKLFRASTVEAYTQAVNELNAALQFQDSAMQTLDDTVKKYGFSLEELGPKLQAQDLDKKAQTLYQDFKVLTSAGIDVGTVIGKMKGGLQDFVDEARKTGIAIPLSMKPILQQMIDMGELVDENGNAFNSLEDTGLSFTESLSQGMDRLIDTIDKLTDAILRGLNAAAGIDVRPPTGPGHPAETGAASGGVVTRWGVEPISWRAVGQDIIPAMLAPGEIVLNPSQQAQVAAGLAGANGWRAVSSDLQGLRDDLAQRLGETTITINVSTLDASDFETVTEKKIMPAILNQLRRGRSLTPMQDVLGLR